MGFYKKDYFKKKAKRRKQIVIYSALAILVLLLIWSVITGLQPKDESTEQKPSTHRSTRYSDYELPELVRKIKKSVVTIITYDYDGNKVGLGTGFFVNLEGHVLSNYHVFSDAYYAEIFIPVPENRFGGGSRFTRTEKTVNSYEVDKILAEDVSRDLLLFSVKGCIRSPLSLEKSRPTVGEKILVIGSPYGLEMTVSNGIISGIRNTEDYGQVIQITCPISPGSSGSPVVNMYGNVVGVATFQFSEGQNLNFAIPIGNIDRLYPLNKSNEKNFRKDFD